MTQQQDRNAIIEQCADIAAKCAKGVSIEVNGEIHLLGVMMHDPAAAQYATAMAIMEAIEGLLATSTDDAPLP